MLKLNNNNLLIIGAAIGIYLYYKTQVKKTKASTKTSDYSGTKLTQSEEAAAPQEWGMF